MSFKIVSDSSSNVCCVDGISYKAVPLKIYMGDTEYVDSPELDAIKMMEQINQSSEKTSTSCPNIYDWIEAFGDAKEVFAITISSNLSGSYISAKNAANEYLALHPDAKVCVIDSLSAGPEMHLIIDKIKELHNERKSFDEIKTEIDKYRQNISLFFCLSSLDNLAKNGRINMAIAKISKIIGIWVIGKASDDGRLQLLHKCRGKIKSLNKIVDEMSNHGFKNKKVIISHSDNIADATELKDKIEKQFVGAEVFIEKNGGLCSYYAELGGMIIGFVCN